MNSLEIDSSGTLAIKESASETTARQLEIFTGSTLEIGAGQILTVIESATKDGEPIGDGVYDSTSGYFTGEGRLVIGNHPVNEWTGVLTGGNWATADNWSLGHVPVAGEQVKVGVTKKNITLTLTASTAALLSLEVGSGSTVDFCGWDVALTASVVKVAGKLVPHAAFGGNTPEHRVWIVCDELMVAQGGLIDADSKGYRGYGGPGGCAGDTAISKDNCSAAHGGYGSMFNVNGRGTWINPLYGVVYDDPHAPTQPGSGGMKNGTTGGGAILIEATGKVTVNGSILASAGASSGITAATPACKLCGSGGSIWIKCSSFSGKGGVVRADGGNADLGCGPQYLAFNLFGLSGDRFSAVGGGGMVRIEYDPAAQANAALENMVVSAAGGRYLGWNNGTGALTVANNDLWKTQADLGTLTFTDTTIVDQLLGRGLSGRLIDVSSYTYDGNLNYTNGNVRFAGEGADVTVTGDLTITGDSSRLEIGGVAIGTNRSFMADCWGGKKLNKLTVGGNMTVTSGAAFDIRAAETNATMRWGGEVAVTGDLTIGNGAYFYPWCDVINLGASHVTVGGDFTVEAGGTVSADRRGGAGSCYGVSGAGNPNSANNYFVGLSHVTEKGYGICGSQAYTGASYGGQGGNTVSAAADGRTDPQVIGWPDATCGNEWEPTAPGSGGGSTGYNPAGEAGGLVCVEALGDVTIDGLVTAKGFGRYGSGGNASKFDNYGRGGAGSGGAVYLCGKTFAGAGTICVHGGDGPVSAVAGTGDFAGTTVNYAASCGGGGRVTIAVGAENRELEKYSTRRRKTPEHEVIATRYSFTGTFDVSGGTNVCGMTSAMATLPQISETHGQSGTVRFVGWTPPSGFLMTVR